MHHNIFWFKISMHNFILVKILKSTTYLFKYFKNFLISEFVPNLLNNCEILFRFHI